MNSFQPTYIGKPHYYFETIDSTNDYALEWISKSSPSEGTAISAGFQSRGRGQIGRTWEGSKDVNIYTSIILKPTFLKVRDLFLLNQSISLGVSAAIEELVNFPVSIKWPNDVLIKDKKVCGILIQNLLEGMFIQYSIVGIGINVNQTSFPPSLPHATSLFLEKDLYFDLHHCRKVIFGCVEYYYNFLKEKNYSDIQKNYKDNLYGLGKNCSFENMGKTIQGIIEGVDETGKLKVNSQGKLKHFSHHEIKMLLDR